MGNKNSFWKLIVGVFPPLPCVSTHQNTPDQQTAKTSPFKDVTPADDHFIKCIWIVAPS